MKIIGWMLFVAVLIRFFSDPIASYRNQRKLDKLQLELNEAIVIWNSQNITDYSFDVEYYAYFWGGCGATITVEQGKMVQVVSTMNGMFDKLVTPVVLDRKDWDQKYCQYSNLTALEIFKIVQSKIDLHVVIEASFDTETGFVMDYGGRYIYDGHFSSYASESGFGATFSNFQRLDSSEP